MKRSITIIFSLLIIVPMTTLAHGPLRQTVEEKIAIDASPDKVWAVVSDFGGLHAWHPSVNASEMDGDRKRALTLAADGDPSITEELKDLDNEKMMMKYKIVDQDIVKTVDFRGETYLVPAVPVENYLSVITVKPAKGGSQVTWRSKFYRVYKLDYYKDEPRYPEGLGNKEAVETITDIYKTGLQNLKKLIEAS